ncbi:MAG: hypothetical protein KDC54_02455 [Lewinella sp.]|nr:hypothetical protein [Lewinella sp.]
MRPLFSCLLLLSAFALRAQYMPIAANGEVFFKTELEILGGPFISEITIIDFDVIDGKVYNRVFIKPGFEADMLIGHYLEDSGAGTAYFRPLDGEDILVYDISLEVGDTLVLPARWCDGIAHDTATVVSVTEEDGRRLLTFDRQVGGGEICETLTFREEIGPSATLIFPYFVGRTYSEGIAMRVCHVARDEVIFYPPNAPVDFCGVPTPADELDQALPVSAFPTVFRDRLILRGVAAGDQCILYDFLGRPRLLWPGEVPPTTLSQLPAGAYVLRISRQGTPLLTQRLVKR